MGKLVVTEFITLDGVIELIREIWPATLSRITVEEVQAHREAARRSPPP